MAAPVRTAPATLRDAPALVTRICAQFGCADTGVTVYQLDRYELLVSVAADLVSCADGLASRPLGVGAAGQAAARQQAVLLEDYQRVVQQATPGGCAGVRSAIAIPLVHKGCVTGAVSVGTGDPQRIFTPADLAVLADLVGPVDQWGLLQDGADGETDPTLLERLYDSHHRVALGLAYRILRDRGEAEDVVQDALLAAWRHASSYDSARGSDRTWLLTLVRHLAFDRLRARARRPVTPFADGADWPTPGDIAEEVATAVDRLPVLEALEVLPPLQREALLLAFFRGLTHTELATHLGVPLSTVKGRIRLGLNRLRTTVNGASAW